MKPFTTMLSRAAVAGLALNLTAPAFADYTVRCGSIDGRHNTCRLSQPGYVTIERKISGASCNQGRSWDFDRREIWVDHGCEADFRVETHSSSGDSDSAKVAGVVVAAAILGALAANKDHVDDAKYRDDSYYGPRHTSYLPGWMVGTFRSYNPQYGAEIDMRITSDGRMTANTRGQTLNGWINDQQLHVGGAVFSTRSEGGPAEPLEPVTAEEPPLEAMGARAGAPEGPGGQRLRATRRRRGAGNLRGRRKPPRPARADDPPEVGPAEAHRQQARGPAPQAPDSNRPRHPEGAPNAARDPTPSRVPAAPTRPEAGPATAAPGSTEAGTDRREVQGGDSTRERPAPHSEGEATSRTAQAPRDTPAREPNLAPADKPPLAAAE